MLRALFLGSYVQASLALPSSCLSLSLVLGLQTGANVPSYLLTFLVLDPFRHLSILLSNQKAVINPKLKKTRKKLKLDKVLIVYQFFPQLRKTLLSEFWCVS